MDSTTDLTAALARTCLLQVDGMREHVTNPDLAVVDYSCTCRHLVGAQAVGDGYEALDAAIAAHQRHADKKAIDDQNAAAERMVESGDFVSACSPEGQAAADRLRRSAEIMAKVTGSTGCTYTEEVVDWSSGERRIISSHTVTI